MVTSAAADAVTVLDWLTLGIAAGGLLIGTAGLLLGLYNWWTGRRHLKVWYTVEAAVLGASVSEPRLAIIAHNNGGKPVEVVSASIEGRNGWILIYGPGAMELPKRLEHGSSVTVWADLHEVADLSAGPEGPVLRGQVRDAGANSYYTKPFKKAWLAGWARVAKEK